MTPIYQEMDDRPNPEDERAEAWEFWHERANKFEAELLKLKRLVMDLECTQSVEVRQMIAEWRKAQEKP